MTAAMRILHAPRNIANQAWATAQGLRALGHDAEVWQYGATPYGFPVDRTFDFDDRPDRVVDAVREAIRRDFEVYHFHFARSLTHPMKGLPWFWDLPILRALGKRILFTFHGSDVRKRSIHLEEDPWSYFRFADVPCDEDRIDKALAVIGSYAHTLIVASPLNLRYVPGARYVPKVVETDRFRFVGARRDRRPLIVHVPSKRATKGTEFVARGLEALERDGHEFDHRIVQDLAHDEMRRVYEDADIVVDNLLLGDCEVSSLEAMALGKPVITRIRPEVLAAHPDLPVVAADPDTFVEATAGLIRDADHRRRIGELGRAYVDANHAPKAVAELLLPLYETPAPAPVHDLPDWAEIEPIRDREHTEQRMLDLEVTIAGRTRMIDQEDDLMRQLQHRYGGRRPLTVLREMRGLRNRRR